MSSDARFIIVLDKLPPLLAQGGDAMAKVMTAIFESVAAPFGQIDNLNIVDMGGNGKGLSQMASVVPNTVFQFLASAKAHGMDLGGLLAKIGVDPAKAMEMLAGLGSTTSASTEPAPEASPTKEA
jgi:hypothetical protein